MLSISEALQRVLEAAERLPSARTSLAEALNCVLAANLTTPQDSPAFDRSMMDGFAVDSRTVFVEGVSELAVLETITAGTLPTQRPSVGTTCRIMTGAPLPKGADCVVPIEHTTFSDQTPDVVSFSANSVEAERHVLRRGTLAPAGSELLSEGTVLKPQHIAALAEFGLANVPVVSIPRVAVLATGDELIPVEEPLTPGKIRNSNESMLVAQVRRSGAVPLPLGIARDDPEELSARIRSGLECNVLLLSGGVSAGTRDLVPSQLAAAGVRQIFHRINLKPGKPLWFGTVRGESGLRLVFGLPGNPVSSMVCFEMFVRPAINRLAGRAVCGPDRQPATLTRDIRVKGGRLTCFPSILSGTSGGLTVTPVAWGGSADLRSTAVANGVCLLEPDPGVYAAGDTVPVSAWEESFWKQQS